VIEQDADYVETRLLNAGPRTNPWFQETGPRPIRTDELVALDTDVVGPHGYYADFSRTFFCGPGRPTAEQRSLYALAVEQILTNIALIRPGLSFRELAERAWPIPDRFLANRYFVVAHGCGMTGEYPYILHRVDFEAAGYDGLIEPGMTLCIESYLGAEGGHEGVKLEEQVLVTATGTEVLSRFPYDDTLLGRQV
jgi:Xaa-Pro aminopeptidase